jgi:micrococcal nuclease
VYEYNAKVLRVVDGDTIDLEIDLGMHVFVRERIRLADIDAPEVRRPTKEAGRRATEFLYDLCYNTHREVTIKTRKDTKGKYGRYLATVFDQSGLNLNQEMIDTGHAVEYE